MASTALVLDQPSSRMSFLQGLGTPAVMLMMLAMIVLPLPAMALDVLFTISIALSIMVLMASVYATRPLDFGVFPTVLLLATLMRLALNVASTRVVLLNGHTGTDSAGRVIEAFGEFVVGGSYAVGLVLFTILVVINFVVVTKGATRVSEVTARFTLDAMPGKQMAIDADLNAGLISQEEALERRERVTRESDFYGAMDGASKFVRGDAVAGILILFINITITKINFSIFLFIFFFLFFLFFLFHIFHVFVPELIIYHIVNLIELVISFIFIFFLFLLLFIIIFKFSIKIILHLEIIILLFLIIVFVLLLTIFLLL